MNNFLQRVSIIESRLPQKWAYQNALMDVFTALLKMCAFAQKFIEQGRFSMDPEFILDQELTFSLEKWVINAFQGQDAELASSRKNMDTALDRFQSATQLTTLANSEDMLRMQAELQTNLESQRRIAANQQVMLETALVGQSNVQGGIDEIKRSLALLASLERDRREDARQARENQAKVVHNKPMQKKPASNRIRSVIPDMPDLEREAQLVSESIVKGTCKWIFDKPAWQEWSQPTNGLSASPLLLLVGEMGTGKSHVAVSVYNYLCQQSQQDTHGNMCVTYFSFREGVEDRYLFLDALICAVLQINDQSVALRGQLEAELNQDDHDWPENCANYWRDLIAKLFDKDSKYTLYMILDGLDELQGANEQGDGRELKALSMRIKMIKKQGLRIKIFATAREEIKTRFQPDAGSELHIAMDDIVPDLRRLTRTRLQSTDTAYRGVSQLSHYVRQKIEKAVSVHAKSELNNNDKSCTNFLIRFSLC